MPNYFLEKHSKKILYLALALLALFVFYFGLSGYALINNNEGLYAEIAREMTAMRSYVIPTLNFVPYIEKPPLLYWLISISYQVLGVSTFSARFVPATCGLLIVVMLIFWGIVTHRRREAIIASFILCSSMGFIIMARIVFFDMLLTLCLCASLLFFYMWYMKNKKTYLRFSYAFLGLAILTKGLLALFLIPAIAFLFLLSTPERYSRLLQLIDGWGILILLLIVAPWHLIAVITHPGFAWDYFMNEQVLRFFNERIPHDYYTGPFYYYLPRLLIYLFPWSFLFPAMLIRPQTHSAAEADFRRFLWLWIGVPLVFFSFSKAKANYYMVISTPAFALLIASVIHTFLKEKKSAWLQGIFIFSGVIGIAALLYVKYYKLDFLSSPISSIFLGCAVFYLAAGTLIGYAKKNQPLIAFFLIVGWIIPLNLYATHLMPRIENQTSEAQLAQQLPHFSHEGPVFLYQDFEEISSLLFYTKQRLAMIDSQSDDLLYGQHTPAAKGWFFSIDAFLREARKKRVIVVLLSEKLPDFMAATRSIPFHVLFQKEHVIVVGN